MLLYNSHITPQLNNFTNITKQLYYSVSLFILALNAKIMYNNNIIKINNNKNL